MESYTDSVINFKLKSCSILVKKFYEYYNDELPKVEIKYKLLLYFFIAVIFSISLLHNFNNKLLSKITLKINNISGQEPLNKNHNILKKNILDSNYKNICFSTDKRIYWKNQTDLELQKSIDEILNNKSLKISFKNSSDFNKRENPKISIIITVHNQHSYLRTFYAYIQQQELKDIEIIFIDDASTDNSSIIIKELMEKDKRIIYLKNNVNKKQYYSINYGVLQSKGEYIISVDPDDFIINNILIKAYETAKIYNLDILQFYMLFGKSIWNIKYKNGIICSNENIRKIFYYGNTRNLPDKIIRRTIYIKAINFMPKELYNEDYQAHTDDTSFFGLIHFANSYGFLEQIGYFYNQDPNRRPKNKSKKEKINREIRSLFNIMKYFIIKSDNNFIEKIFIPYKFFEEKVKMILLRDMKYISKDFEFYIDVLNLYLECPFFSKDEKNVILKVRRKISLRKRYFN